MQGFPVKLGFSHFCVINVQVEFQFYSHKDEESGHLESGRRRETSIQREALQKKLSSFIATERMDHHLVATVFLIF